MQTLTERLAHQLNQTASHLHYCGQTSRALRTAGAARTLEGAAEGDTVARTLARQYLTRSEAERFLAGNAR